MNIFILDQEPTICAQMHADKHVVKMILETAQLLSAAHHHYETDVAEHVYRVTHKNHPCTVWVRASKQNYAWAVQLFRALLVEFEFRRGTTHKSGELLTQLRTIPDGFPDLGLTPFAQAMPDQFKSDDVVKAYRDYYLSDKAYMAAWNWGRPSPDGWSPAEPSSV